MLKALLKRIAIECLKPIDKVLLGLAPRIRVLFVVVNDIGYFHQISLLRRLYSDDQFAVKLVIADYYQGSVSKEVRNALAEFDVMSVRRARWTRWHYAVITDIAKMSFPRTAAFIQISHSYCFGNLLAPGPDCSAADDYFLMMISDRFANIIVLSSLGYVDLIQRLYPQVLEDDKKAFFVTGTRNMTASRQPRSKRLLEKHKHRRLLVTSHWTPHSLFRDLGVAVIHELRERFPLWEIMVSAHPKLWSIKTEDGFDGMRLAEHLTSLARTDGAITFAPTGNPVSLFEDVDGLLCDHSSIRVLFSAQSKPCVLYRHPGCCAHFAITEMLYVRSSAVFHSLDEMESAISDTVLRDEELLRWNSLMFDYFRSWKEDPDDALRDILATIGPIGSIASAKWNRVRETEQAHWSEMLADLTPLSKRIDRAIEDHETVSAGSRLAANGRQSR